MGVLPVPEAMMDMYRKIEEVARKVESQQKRWDKIVDEVSKLKTYLLGWSGPAINGSLIM